MIRAPFQLTPAMWYWMREHPAAASAAIFGVDPPPPAVARPSAPRALPAAEDET